MGHSNVSVLDGGLTKWVHDGYSLESGHAPSSLQGTDTTIPSEWDEEPPKGYVADFQSEKVIDYSTMLVHATDFMYAKNATIIDVRPDERFRGMAYEPIPTVKSGSIPGSINLDWRLFLQRDEASGAVMLKEPLDLIRVFKSKNVDLDRDIVLLGSTYLYNPVVKHLSI
jgi:thiosulfate/3-mercaptopyruvate sulfurtransferase